MGFMKSLVYATSVDKKKYTSSGEKTKKETLNRNIQCDKCGSFDVKHTKTIGWGMKTGNVYHYRLVCKCGRAYFVQRTKEVFERVKDEPWQYSKSFKHLKRKISEK